MPLLGALGLAGGSAGGSAERRRGEPTAVDVGGAHYSADDGTLLLSLDTASTVAGIVIEDEDVLCYDPGSRSWQLFYDGSRFIVKRRPRAVLSSLKS